MVLEGVFEDEFGQFAAGSYIRNPPESRHQPSSPQGATILVKLWQFDPADRETVRLQTRDMTPRPAVGREGVTTIPLYRDTREDVRIEEWAPGATLSIDNPRGLEIFVIGGGFREAEEAFAEHSWLRLPAGHDFEALAGLKGARVWIKSGHLDETPRRPSA